MPSRKVALDEEAYDALRAAKLPGESVSDAVKRLASKKRPLSDFVGIWKDQPEEEFERFQKWRRESRQADLRRQRQLIRRVK